MRYMVAAGKSITSKKGVIGEYCEISIKALGSSSIFNELIKQGAIVEYSEKPVVIHSVNLRPNRYKYSGNKDRVLNDTAKAEVKKVEVIEPIKKKEFQEEQPEKRKYEKKKNLFEGDEPEIEDLEIEVGED